jgi:hypothetical protein
MARPKTSKKIDSGWRGSYAVVWEPSRRRWLLLYSAEQDMLTATVAGHYESFDEADRMLRQQGGRDARRPRSARDKRSFRSTREARVFQRTLSDSGFPGAVVGEDRAGAFVLYPDKVPHAALRAATESASYVGRHLAHDARRSSRDLRSAWGAAKGHAKLAASRAKAWYLSAKEKAKQKAEARKLGYAIGKDRLAGDDLGARHTNEKLRALLNAAPSAEDRYALQAAARAGTEKARQEDEDRLEKEHRSARKGREAAWGEGFALAHDRRRPKRRTLRRR